MGEALRGDDGTGRTRRRSVIERLTIWYAAQSRVLRRGAARLWLCSALGAHAVSAQPARLTGLGGDAVRLAAGRFTVLAEQRDERLARALLLVAQREDTFPGLPRPIAPALIAIAPDQARFRQWVGPHSPEWGAAIAVPDEGLVVLQGSASGSDAGDPAVVLRHELAHLALHEAMGRLPPRWFDEGYASVAAGEWTRENALETAVGMVWHALPTLAQLEQGFDGGSSRAQMSYALAHRVVEEMSMLDAQQGLGNFLAYWKASGSFEPSIRRAFGMTGEQFEKHWRQQTRRRYGALALATDLSAVLGFFALLLGPLYWMRRRRDRLRLEAMRAVDLAQERAFRESMISDLLSEAAIGDGSVAPASASPPAS